jgi:toxin ParE1/3/4
MANYRTTPQSDKDIESILFYTRLSWGEKQMEKYAQEIYQTLDRVALLPEIGSLASFLTNNIRKILVGKHLIFYQVQDDTVWILRVLDSNMDIEEIGFDGFSNSF